MRVPLTRSAAAGLLLLVLAVPVASASPGVSITIDSNFQTGVEVFTASGFCASGTSVTPNLRFIGVGNASTFHLDKTLTCDDGSGTLTIHVDAATHGGSPQDQGGWSVVGGTGAWSGAHGGGDLVGVYVPNGIIDHYTGSLFG
jgi:hypothetical protein